MKVLTAREAAIVAALADAIAAPEPPLPPVGETDAVAAFDRWLAHAPRLNRGALRAVLYPAGAQLRSRSRAGRVEALRRLDRSRTPGVRQMAEALRAAVAACYFGDAAVMRTLGYDAERNVERGRRIRRERAAAAPLAPEPQVEDGARITGERRVRADVCVIGAGAGGAVVAKELAQAGLRVVVLEEGAHHDADTLDARPRNAFPVLYRDAGQTTTVGNPPIVLPLGKGVGGTTFINSGTCFRTPDHVLERWRREFGLELELDAYFRRVEREINVTQVPAAIAGRSAELVKRGADALGWSGDYLYRNVRGCVGSGVCAFGCPAGAKQHTGIVYMEQARAAGATTFTRVRAGRIEMDGRRARAVEATAAGGGRVRVEADQVVIAAGTIHTPGLLAANRLGGASGELGRNLAIHPATAVWAMFEERVDLATGVPQSYYVDEFAREGIMFEGVGGPPDYVAMAMPYTGDRQRELMLRYPHIAQLGLMVSDRSRGRVLTRFGRPVVRYDVCREDVETFHRGLVRLVELWWAAGAESVMLPLGRLKELHGGDIAPLRELELRANDLKLMAFHPLGTARADARPHRGVVDADLRLHAADNVHVADGSVVPSALGVNPQITIMALATRLAFHLLGAPAPEHEPHPETLPHVLSH